jgi:HK97 family phage major capsid protein
MVHNALLTGAALGVDAAILVGTGSGNQPRGVKNLTGINTQTVATPGTPTWAETVGFESAVDADDAAEGKLAYVTTAAVRGKMKTTSKDTGSGRFIEENGEVNGRPVASSSQLAANDILFGNWADAYVGFWGVIDVNPDTATKVASGGLVLRVFQDADVGAGHAESFCKNS